MRYVLNSEEMKQCDKNTMEHYGLPSAVLMERAAYSVYEEITKEKPDTGTTVLIACGAGNNGGDGFALARLLYLKGYPVDILFAGKEDKTSIEAKRQLTIVRNYEIPLFTELPKKEYDVIVDSLFGIGLCRNIEGDYADLIEKLNVMEGYKVAVDICSGLSADDGAVMGVAFRADLTVTFGFAKLGHLLFPGAAYSGRVTVKDIGIDEMSLLSVKPKAGVLDTEDFYMLPKRKSRTNKGSYGKLLIFAGSRNMAGAAAFSARAAYSSGSGLVRVVTEESNREIIQTLVPEAILTTYDMDTDMDRLVQEILPWADAIVAGPGIGIHSQAENLIRAILKYAKVPCVLDADGLNLIAEHKDWLWEKKAPVIVTPHLGEMSRLCGMSIPEIQNNLISVAGEFAKKYQVVTVLKDARTVISLPEGFFYINTSGNNGMATGGSGDVLTGVIGSFLGQKMDVKKAAPLSVFIHGMAGDVTAERYGKAGLMASDLIEGIREVLKEGM